MAADVFDVQRPYQIIKGDGYVTLRLNGALEGNSIKAFNADVLDFMKDPYPFVVVNCDTLSALSKDWIRSLLQMQNDLKKFNKAIRFILVKPALMVVFKRDGVDTAFKKAPTLRDALVEFGLVTKKALDTDFVNPFLDATLHVLKVQASIVAEAQKLSLKKPDQPFTGDISGIIGIVSETFNGSVVISFPEKTFLGVMSGMLGETYTEITKEITDGAGELTNMIFGQAKIVLNDKGYGIKTAIPSVVSGKNHSLQTLTNGPVVVVPFVSSVGPFFIEICLSA